MTDALYASCAEVLSICQGISNQEEKENDFSIQDKLLDPKTGFAPRLKQLCREQIAELSEMHHSQQEIDLLQLEENTWSLLQAILPMRMIEQPQDMTARELLRENPYTPPSTLAQAIMLSSPLLNQLVVIREWLHDTAPEPQNPGASSGYWPSTKNAATVGRLTGAGAREGLVRALDPDVVNREEGRGHLLADDANYDRSIVQALYGYIRAGRLDAAIELCEKAHQPWRAASIRGATLFKWPLIANEPLEEDQIEIPQGNPNRRLWKSTCERAALNQALPTHERTLYASLAPSPQTSTVLKASCRTWEDHLWAQVCLFCEERQMQEMSKLGGSFWEGGMRAVEEGVTDAPGPDAEQEWENEVLTSLEALRTIGVSEGPGADHPFHFSQLYIILDKTNTLVELFADGLRQGLYTGATVDYPSLCRFFAHLCLFLRMLELPVPPADVQAILEAYLQVLENAGQRELIALYAGALQDNANERYASFLVSLGLSADIKEREEALKRAEEHDLDVEEVARITAELSTDEALKVLPRPRGPLPSIIGMQPPPLEEETFLIRSIEWTTFQSSTFDAALMQANVIVRYFLGCGRVQVARDFLRSLPPQLANIVDEPNSTEFMHYQQFFDIWDLLDRVVQHQSYESPNMPRDTRDSYVKTLTTLLDNARGFVTKLLTSEWLLTDEETDLEASVDQRLRDLVRIRQIFVPELIIRLHFMLFNSRKYIPRNLKHALELANIVADLRYRLYQDFSNEEGRKLSNYLGAVRQAILGGLEGGGSDPFKVVLD